MESRIGLATLKCSGQYGDGAQMVKLVPTENGILVSQMEKEAVQGSLPI